MEKKKIGLEITGALAGGGYRCYVQSIIRALAQQDKINDYFLYGSFWRGNPQRAYDLDLPRQSNFHWSLKRFPQGLLLPLEEWAHINIQERFFDSLGLDLVHGLGSMLPRLRRIPSVVTMHFSGIWDFKSAWDKLYFNSIPGRSVNQAQKVIAISELTRTELIKTWNLPLKKIEVIHYGGPADSFKPLDETARTGYEGSPYFLYVGMTRPQKNPILLAEAFMLLMKKHPQLPHRVVFVGGHGEDKPRLQELFSKAGLSDRAVFAGQIPPAEIHSLYQKATAYVIPSVWEGFALPIVEAMACGTPVIGANGGAVPETIADAGLVCEPNPEAMASAMERLLLENGLFTQLQRKGFARAKCFSWETAAKKTLDVYRQALTQA